MIPFVASSKILATAFPVLAAINFLLAKFQQRRDGSKIYKMSAMPKIEAPSPRGLNSAGQEIANKNENHHAVIFPTLDLISVLLNAIAKILPTSVCNSVACKPTHRDPSPDAPEILKSICRGFAVSPVLLPSNSILTQKLTNGAHKFFRLF